MKGQVKAIVPTVQFGNITTTYEFENDEERKAAMDRAVNDCAEYTDIVINKIREYKELNCVKESVINGTRWKSKGDMFKYFNTVENVWIECPYNSSIKDGVPSGN